jgi:flagellar biosynthesis protein FlhG
MTSSPRRLLARTLRDVTSVCAKALRNPVPLAEVKTDNGREIDPASCQVICIASGKGGTGKTIVSTNLAVALVRKGLSVVLLDADMGLANAHLLLGTEPAHDISSVISGRRRIDEISVDCPAGVKLIAGGSGMSELAELKEWQVKRLAGELRSCEEKADIMIIDLAAGISSQVMRFLINAHDAVIVTTPDVTAQLDAYATIKTMARAKGEFSARVIINRARNEEEAIAAYKKLTSVARNRLKGVKLSLLGWLPHNWYVQNSVHMRKPVVELHPKSFVTRTFLTMADELSDSHSGWRDEASSSKPGRGPASFSQMLERINFR